jgi:hypothetical protein
MALLFGGSRILHLNFPVMKRIALPLLMLVAVVGYSQEFKVYNNGLIYSEQTMARLGKIVDSLNIRFRACDLAHPFYAIPQGLATWIEVPNKKARLEIENGIDLDQYLKRYPQAASRSWVTKFQESNKPEITIRELGNDTSRTPLEYSKKIDAQTRGWILTSTKKGAWYLHDVRPREMPLQYARLVQYVDCMIDTSAYIYSQRARDEKRFTYTDFRNNVKGTLFLNFVESYPGHPAFDYDLLDSLHLNIDSAVDVFRTTYDKWKNDRLARLDSEMKIFPQLRNWLVDGMEDALKNSNSCEELEFYVARYISAEVALKLKRDRKVYGTCSQDSRPRNHAVGICLLSAETSQWDIFLRSHLDIMNDRFERASDGSYAWAQRETYIRELEELDVNAIELLLGTCLSVDNVSDNHYWGSISRVGRALAEAQDTQALETRLLMMINDPNLDPLNRLRMAYLFAHYSYNLNDKQLSKKSFETLNAAIKKTPDYLQRAWSWE